MGRSRPPGLPMLLPWACWGPRWAREDRQLSSDLGFSVWGDDVGNKENLSRIKNSAGSFQNSESLGIGLLLTTGTVYLRPRSTSLPLSVLTWVLSSGGRPRGPATAPALCRCPRVCSTWVCASHTEGWLLPHTSLHHGVAVRGFSLHRRGCWFQCPAAVGCQARGSRNLQPVGPRRWGPWAPVVRETGPVREVCASGSLSHTVGTVTGPHRVQQRSPVSGARCCAVPTSPRAPSSAPCVGTVRKHGCSSPKGKPTWDLGCLWCRMSEGQGWGSDPGAGGDGATWVQTRRLGIRFQVKPSTRSVVSVIY